MPPTKIAVPLKNDHPMVKSPTVNEDEVIIEITATDGVVSRTLSKGEISRMRGRFGRGPGFEKWMLQKLMDHITSYGGA